MASPEDRWLENWQDRLGKAYRQLAPVFDSFVFLKTWPTEEYLNKIKKEMAINRQVFLPDFALYDPSASRSTSRKQISLKGFVMPKNGYYAYDENIVHHHQVKTRKNNWHDFFNYLIWLSFPRTKWALHNLSYHYASLYLQENQTNRSPINNFTTFFDEGGVVVFLSENYRHEFIAAKPQKEPMTFAWLQKMNAQIFYFGHALFESVLKDHLNINAFTCVFFLPSKPQNTNQGITLDLLDALDQRMASYMQIEHFSREEFMISSLNLADYMRPISIAQTS